MAAQKYTEEQIAFIIQARTTKGQDYLRIARDFEKKFKLEANPEKMRNTFRLYTGGPRGSRTPELASTTSKIEPRKVAEVHPLASFTRQNFSTVKGAFEGRRGRFFVTAAAPVTDLSRSELRGEHRIGRNLQVDAFNAALTLCTEMNAQLIILTGAAHIKALGKQPSHYDPALLPYKDCMYSEFDFNEHLTAVDLHLTPTQARPLTGLSRVGRGKRERVLIDGRPVPTKMSRSMIFAHPKQDLQFIATGNDSFPRLIHTTGYITEPEYRRTRPGALAEEDHIIGGLIVEVDEHIFHLRQVQIIDGQIYDMGVRYSSDGTTADVRAEAIRPGDLHAGLEDDTSLEMCTELIGICRPKRIFVEDVIDSGSVSHHKRGKGLTKALDHLAYRQGLKKELQYCYELLDYLYREWCASGEEFYIVDSNHHDHIFKWLDDGNYTKEDVNYDIAHRMVVEILDGIDPLKSRVDPEDNYIWLKSTDDLYVEGVQMAAHGHLGVNGSKGSPAGLEVVHGDGMTGHTHTAGIRGRLYTTGHMSIPRHGYNKGPSTWVPCPGIVWPGGAKQLIISLNGQFRLEGDVETTFKRRAA